MSEFVPKKITRKTPKSKKLAKKRENAKRYARDKQRRKEKEEWESLKKFADAETENEVFIRDIMWAKNRYVLFVQRTGRFFTFDNLVYHTKRRGQDVVSEMHEMFPKYRCVGWRAIRPGFGRRPILPQEDLRKLCARMQIPYWREMKTDEMRAMLLLLMWKLGFWPEPEEKKFVKASRGIEEKLEREIQG